MSKKILIIATSHSQMGQTDRRTGVWAEELAVPYAAFENAGYEVDLATPLGGEIPFDPNSLEPTGPNAAIVKLFFSDEKIKHKIKHTARVADVDTKPYVALFFPGGHGVMWDLPNNAAVARAVEYAAVNQQIISTVCHGAAGLVGARLPSGPSVVAGKVVNCFTDSEEEETGLTNTVPFLLADKLVQLGGKFERGPNWQSFAVEDDLLITGQNPASSAKVAELVLQKLAQIAATHAS